MIIKQTVAGRPQAWNLAMAFSNYYILYSKLSFYCVGRKLHVDLIFNVDLYQSDTHLGSLKGVLCVVSRAVARTTKYGQWPEHSRTKLLKWGVEGGKGKEGNENSVPLVLLIRLPISVSCSIISYSRLAPYCWSISIVCVYCVRIM